MTSFWCSHCALSPLRSYVPSPAGAVRFDLDCGDGVDPLPPTSTASRRPVTEPIAIPCRPAGLPPPAESALLRRRQRQRHLSHSLPAEAAYSSDEGTSGPEDHVLGPEDRELGPEGDGQRAEAAGEDRGDGEEDIDEVDQAEAASDQVALLYREARSLQVGWREGAVLPTGFTFRGMWREG